MSVHILYLGRTARTLERLLVEDDLSRSLSVSAVPTVEAAINWLPNGQPSCLVWDVDIAADSAIERLFSIAPGLPVVVRTDRSPPVCLDVCAPLVTHAEEEMLLDVVHSVSEPSKTNSLPPEVLLSLLDRSTKRTARIDRAGRFRFVSEELARFLDSPQAELVGNSVSSSALCDPAMILERGRWSIDSEKIQCHVDDSHQYVFVPIGDEQFQLVVQERDSSSDSYWTEPTNEFIDTVLDRLTDIFFVFDLQGRFLHWNDRLTEVTSYSDEEISSMTPMDFFVEEDYERVNAAISNVVENGDATEIVRIRTRGGRLLPCEFTGSAVNDIGERIDDAHDHDIYICGTGRDISQRVTAERQRKEAIDELERSNAELERFAYVASHDLKEPLRMIRSYLDLIERRYEGELDEDTDEFISYAIDGAERMRAMIDDLLTYSRAGTDDISVQLVDCNVVLDRVLDSLHISIDEADAEITVGWLPTIEGNPQQLGQLFQNLISNAIAYAGEGLPNIRVAATDEDDEWLFSVSDNGVGIKPEQRTEVFEIFSSGAISQSTGIGLAICQKIVRRHSGRIWVDSEPGVGSTFYFSIPKTVSAATDTATNPP